MVARAKNSTTAQLLTCRAGRPRASAFQGLAGVRGPASRRHQAFAQGADNSMRTVTTKERSALPAGQPRRSPARGVPSASPVPAPLRPRRLAGPSPPPYARDIAHAMGADSGRDYPGGLNRSRSRGSSYRFGGQLRREWLQPSFRSSSAQFPTACQVFRR